MSILKLYLNLKTEEKSTMVALHIVVLKVFHNLFSGILSPNEIVSFIFCSKVLAIKSGAVQMHVFFLVVELADRGFMTNVATLSNL